MRDVGVLVRMSVPPGPHGGSPRLDRCGKEREGGRIEERADNRGGDRQAAGKNPQRQGFCRRLLV